MIWQHPALLEWVWGVFKSAATDWHQLLHTGFTITGSLTAVWVKHPVVFIQVYSVTITT